MLMLLCHDVMISFVPLRKEGVFGRFHQQYASLSPDNFAKLFRPKVAMLNKVWVHKMRHDHELVYNMNVNSFAPDIGACH